MTNWIMFVYGVAKGMCWATKPEVSNTMQIDACSILSCMY